MIKTTQSKSKLVHRNTAQFQKQNNIGIFLYEDLGYSEPYKEIKKSTLIKFLHKFRLCYNGRF